jgi:hypothetical protein
MKGRPVLVMAALVGQSRQQVWTTTFGAANIVRRWHRSILEVLRFIEVTRSGNAVSRAGDIPNSICALFRKSRGDKTPLELFTAGVRGWDAGIRRRLDDGKEKPG